ncbi:MAG TPA: hypothetical protein VFN21_09625 [Acidimicrobiales bacterium]|nr:hypothetical protein [Acidimicrobiales bacterium]
MTGEGLHRFRIGYGTVVSACASSNRRHAPGWSTSLVSTSDVFTVQRCSDDPEYRARLIHTARVLADVDQRGAERFVALEDDGESTTLVTRYAGGRSLASAVPRRASRLAAVGAGLVRTLVGLHAVGVTHGPVAASQVRFGSRFEPVLCGFDRGDLHPTDDQRSWRADRAIDVQSVGVLLGALLGDASRRASDPIEHVDRRRLRRVSRRIAAGDLVEATATLAGLERISFAG